MVRTSVNISNNLERIIPVKVQDWIESRFVSTESEESEIEEAEKPAFDMVRAAVSLTVASALIAIGTSLKLPLSTTYVSFMVTMGASLADRAWGRDSAVYRITGVFAVVSGWFITALAAFTLAFIIGGFIYLTKPVGLFIVLFLVALSVYNSHKRKKNKDQDLVDETNSYRKEMHDTTTHWVENSNDFVKKALIQISKIFFVTVNGLIEEDRKSLKNINQDTEDFNQHIKTLKNDMYIVIRKLNEVSIESGQYYVQVLDYMREAAHALHFMSQPVFDHVNNNHKPVTEEQRAELIDLSEKMSEFFNLALHLINENDHYKTKMIVTRISEILELINNSRRSQIKRIKSGDVNTRNSVLYLTILQETKSMILHIGNMLKSLRDFATHTQSQIPPQQE
ncbi:MAG: inorganic phosphate transporter [Salinivirgaceae bacterium]|nr:inorganic phosphate transporter [Salinivirgaceae bacterium]